MIAYIVLALLAFASNASALSCYYGTTYDGSVPSTTYTNCQTCTKNVQRYGTYTVINYGGTGIGCTLYVAPVSWTAPISWTAPTSWTAITSWTAAVPAITWSWSVSAWAAASLSSTCSLYSITSTMIGGTVNWSGSYSASWSGSVAWTCSPTKTVHSCSSDSGSGSYAMCTCCGDNCNGGLACSGASAVMSFSLLGMLLLAVVGYFMRQ